MHRVSRTARATVVVGLTLGYAGAVFQVWTPRFWNAGLGDWIDPYFINSLLEWWYSSLARLENPASPPVFYPTPGTLGYSHGLVLYVPFYVPLRWLLHPFQAYNLAILLVVVTGTLSLYWVLRRAFSLTFVEALVLTAFFAASPNVLDSGLNTWTQRASVYLVPPILLVGVAALAATRWRSALAFGTGWLATLLFTQDFYSGHFTFMFAGCGLVPFVVARLAGAVDWDGTTRPARVALIVGIGAAAWSAVVALTGGGTIRIPGAAIKSTDPVRPLILALVAFCVFAWGRNLRAPLSVRSLPRGSLALAAGMLAGGLIFLWIYLPIYLTVPGFGEEEFQRQLRDRDAALLLRPWQLMANDHAFATVRGLGLIAAAVAAAWWPSASLPAGLRGAAVFWLAVSILVFVIPFRFGDFSVWADLLRPLPGFNAIRDPLRIVYQYELAAVLAVAFVLSRIVTARWRRAALILVAVVLMTVSPNRTVFEFNRPNRDFDRWVAAPIRVDPACRAFYMAPAPPEYLARSPEPWTLYSNDAAFIALRLGVPTLHGVSAWTPDDWHVRQPDAPGFADAVRQWVDQHRLTGVCSLDVARRTMAPEPAIARP